jgi:iron(III) transport system ATP-binding protein
VSAIQIRGLTKRYEQAAAVDRLDLTIQDGEFVTLLGPSGCGKTTTLRCIAGLETPEEGEIQIGERVVVDCRRRLFTPPHKRGAGMVFQSYALWPHMSVFANVAYPLKTRRRGRAEISARVEEALRLVGLGGFGARATSELSGGQQQRVALARALAGEPAVLLLDEPLSNLDAGLRAQLRQEIRRIHRKTGTTSVYVTHDRVEAITLSDRILVINGGHVEQVGTPQEIFLAPATTWVAGFIGFENFLSATVTSVNGDLVSVKPDGWAEALQCRDKGSATFAPGDAVEVAIRASSFTNAEAGGANTIDGTVRETTYLGDFVEYEFAVPGATMMARLSEREAARLGEHVGGQVRFGVGPEQVVLIRPTADAPREHEPVVAHVS